MFKQEGLRVDSLSVPRQVQGRGQTDFAVFSTAALASSLEELPREYFVDEGVFVGGRGAHALESGDS